MDLVGNVLQKEVLRLFISHQHGGLKGPYLIALHVVQMESAFDLFNQNIDKFQRKVLQEVN